MPFEDHYFGEMKPSTRVGWEHSLTAREFATHCTIKAYEMTHRLNGESLPDYTKPDWYYCIVEDGSVFKYHPKELLFYRLDLDRMVWVPKQSYYSLILDTYLKFMEYHKFVDHYPHASDE